MTRMLPRLAATLLATLALASCGSTADDAGTIDATQPDVTTPDTDTATDTDVGTSDVALVGNWRSEGGDLAPLLSAAPFNYVTVDAVFRADLRYTVTATDASAATYPLSGTFTVDTSTNPASAKAASAWRTASASARSPGG